MMHITRADHDLTADLMQPWGLTVDRTLLHAARWHGEREIVSRRFDGSLARTNYAALTHAAQRFSAALKAAGIGLGDRVATLAMNSADHMTVWFGTMGIGAVCHTLNPRLFDEQLLYIINHAADRWLVADPQFAPLIARLLPQCPTLERVVFVGTAAELPAGIPGSIDLESLLASGDAPVTWGGFDEHTPAALCYTSGTTGHPKGVLYTHRSQVLHTFLVLQRDAVALSERDVMLPIVPMFHANAWGIPFAAAAAGAKLVFPGARLDGASVYELLKQERVTVSAAVPTVWQLLLDYLTTQRLTLSTLKRVVIGGSACPESLIRGFGEGHGVEVIQAWGMTEMSPIGTMSSPTHEIFESDLKTRIRYAMKQGRVPFGVDMKVTDDDGRALPHDATQPGHLMVRGPAVVARYYGEQAQVLDGDGFFDTGDIATIDAKGYMEITDRAKDLIKSGGEWISSVEVENHACAHPAVQFAAVIAVPHPRWRERPLLVVQLKSGATATAEAVLAVLEGKIARWWMPDAVVFIDDMPLGATGKLDKKLLRTRFKDYRLPDVS
jgi:fatty-acyl-CoA synthase